MTSDSSDFAAHGGVSASTAQEPVPPDTLGVYSFDPSHLAPSGTWRDLSDGGYSEVYRAKLLGAPVVVKQATSRKKTSCDALLREIKYLCLAGPHPNLVMVYGAFSERGKLNLVLEYASSLRTDRVARSCDPVLVVSGIARALVRLHGLGIIHRDLKARNVLVAHDRRPLLIDFGLACHTGLDAPEWLRRPVGTKKYRPPEMRDGRPAHPSMDCYCLGLLIEKLLKQRRERGGSEEPLPPTERTTEERRDHGRDGGGRDGGGRDGGRDGGRERDAGRDRDREAPARSSRDGPRGDGLGRDGRPSAGGGSSRDGGQASSRHEEGRHERRTARLLGELATQCTSLEPQDRPTAWAVLMRLQRFVGDETSRCDATRVNIPLSAPIATQMLQRRAARDDAEEEDGGRGSGNGSGRSRKRRRADGELSRQNSGKKHDDRRDHDDDA